MLSPLRMPFRHARVADDLQCSIIEQAAEIYTSVSVIRKSWSISGFQSVFVSFLAS
jgi:hypothetical protein